MQSWSAELCVLKLPPTLCVSRVKAATVFTSAGMPGSPSRTRSGAATDRDAHRSAKKKRVEPAPPQWEYASSCCIPTTWKDYTLARITPYNHDTSIFEFKLEPGQSLNLPVCGCILMATADIDSEEVRPYTPISSNKVLGKFDLLIKRYPAWGEPSFAHNYKPPGKMSNYIHGLSVGATVRFKHIPVNVKKQYPFTGVRTITMLAVGVGIAPMLQALECLLTTPGDTTQIVFLYGNRTVEDILMRERLDVWAAEHKDRFKMVYVIGTRWRDPIIGIRTSTPILPKAPKGLDALNSANTVGVEGWVNEKHVKTYAFPPSDDTQVRCLRRGYRPTGSSWILLCLLFLAYLSRAPSVSCPSVLDLQALQVFVCGLPSVYETLCGPRTDKVCLVSLVCLV